MPSSARRSVAWSLAGRRNGPPATSMQLHRPMPRSSAARFRRGAPRLETVELGHLRGLLHVAFEFAAVVGEGERGLVRHRLGRDQVDPAQLVRTDAEFARGDIDDALDRIGRLRPAGAAIGRGRHGVGQDAARLRVHRRDVIDAGGAADIADRPTGAAGDIGAEIRVPAQPQRGEFVLGIEPQFHRDAHLARLLVGEEALGAIGDPAHRAMHLARRPGDQRVFRLHAGLHAERAADIHRQHADIGRLDVEVAVRHAVAQVVRRLMRGVHHDPAVRADLRPGAARFHRVGGDARDGELQPCHMRRRLQRRIGRLRIAALPQEADVVRHIVPDLRRTRAPTRRPHR